MKIKVLAFASLADAWGKKETVLEFDQNSLTVGDVREAVLSGSKDLEGYRSVLLLARNGEFVDPGAALADGDEVALFPPVSGGAR